MSLLRRDKLDIKLDKYATGTASAVLTDPTILTTTQDYKRSVASRMMPLETADVAKRFTKGDYHVSLKIDGEFSVLIYADGEAFVVNPGGTVRVGLPFQKEAADRLQKAGIKKAIFAGEIYFSRPDGKRPRVHDISRVARQPATKAEMDQVHFAATDIIEIDGTPPSAKYHDTWDLLEKYFGGGTRIGVPEAKWLTDGDEIAKQYKKWIDGGAEGAVVRADATGMFKIKPRHTLDAVIIGFTEGTEDRHGMIHDLLLAVMRADGGLHVLGHVGGGFTEDVRRAFLSDLKDRVVASEYVEVNDQVAYHMVRPEIVIEISVLDMIAQTTRGQSLQRMVLTWDAPAEKYRILRRLPLVGLISPQYIRRRDDKQVNVTDIRIKQVTDLVDVPLADRDARQMNQQPSQILRREAYTKVMKGTTMVRKLVMWQTNKLEEQDDFPAFVVHLTDFSANRKTPLEREIRVSNSRQQIDELWQEIFEDNITKGWVLTATSGPAAAAPAKAAPPQAVAASTPNFPPAVEPDALAAKTAPKKRAPAKKKKTEE